VRELSANEKTPAKKPLDDVSEEGKSDLSF
jgi:hypothetical protein